MSLQIFAVILRMIERSLIVTGGILAIYLGYKLFTLGIDKTQGEASAFGVSLRNFGPGLFFAALGAVILVTSMRAAIRTAQDARETVNKSAESRQAVPTGTAFFFGIEDPKRKLKQWSAKSFFIETRDLLRSIENNRPREELELLRTELQKKLDSVTMTEGEFQRYQVLTNKVPLTEDEEKELSVLEGKLFP